MGEEEKKPEEKKSEEPKKAEQEKKPEEGKSEKPKSNDNNKKEDKKNEESKETTPPPPQEIVLRVYMHCEGCARKVRRCLKGFEGVEDVQTDCKAHKVVVKGEKADPLKVLERVQKKSHRQVELLSPIPKPPAENAKKPEEKETPKPEEKKEEPQVVTVVLKVHMHCEACAQEIKKRILRMKGVEEAEPELKSSQVTVKGPFDPPQLVEYVYKRTGKHAVIVKQDLPEKKEEEGKGKDVKEDKKGEDGGGKDKKGGEEENKETLGSKGGGEEAKAGGEGESKVMEVKKNEYYYYSPVYAEMHAPYPPHPAYAPAYPPHSAYPPAYPPQIFSDENPNACSVM